jgi:hypothetical protein
VFGRVSFPTRRLLRFVAAGAFCFSGLAVAKTSRAPSALQHVSYDQVIAFQKGSSELSKADKDALAALLKSVRDRSRKIEQIHVAAWPDASPSTPQGRELAASRMNAIQDHLEGALGQSYVETYNMGERSNWFARAMNASARDIKTMFAHKGAPKNVTPEDFALVRSKGGLTKAVILVELEPASASSRDQ